MRLLSHNSFSGEKQGYFLFILTITLIGTFGQPVLAQTSSPKPTGNQEAQPTDHNETDTPSTLLPEGFRINGLVAKLVKHPEQARWFLLFPSALEHLNQQNPAQSSSSPSQASSNTTGDEAPVEIDPFSQPIEVLPGKWLTAMNRIAGDKIDFSIEFRIWGEITTFHGRNYILPNLVRTFSLFGQQEFSDTSTATPVLSSQKIPSEPVTPESSTSEEKNLLPDRLRKILMAMPRTSPIEIPVDTQSAVKPAKSSVSSTAAAGTTMPSKWKDGDMVIDRVGRLIFDSNEKLWLFTFEADSNSLSEPPIVLHPCRLLEIMENIIKQSPRSTKFRVSGQITRYQTRSYLLLRKMLIVYDLGNLTK